MEGTVRLLLVTIFATAATAQYEYNHERVLTIHEGLHKYKKMANIQLKNMDTDVQWILLDGASQTGIYFNITHPKRTYGENCGGRPQLRINNGLHHCLCGMGFMVMDYLTGPDIGKDYLELHIHFRSSQDDSIVTLMTSEVFKKPENQAQDLSKVVHVEPIPRQQLAKAANKESFVASISWIRNLLESGLYDLHSTSGGEESDTHQYPMYLIYPVVIDTDILDGILKIFPPEEPLHWKLRLKSMLSDVQ